MSDYLTVWKHPRDYGGFSPDGDYVIASQHRDSEALDRSNYRSIVRILCAVNHDTRDMDTRPPVYTFRAGHSACGWVEYLLIRSDAPDETLRQAEEIVCALADYPVVDESDWSELEYTEKMDYWTRCRIRERVDLCRDAGVCIFAARRDEIPEQVYDRITL